MILIMVNMLDIWTLSKMSVGDEHKISALFFMYASDRPLMAFGFIVSALKRVSHRRLIQPVSRSL